MDNDKLMENGIELRNRIIDVIHPFWESFDFQSMEDIMIINTYVYSTLVAQLTYALFQSKAPLWEMDFYINLICDSAKKYLREIQEQKPKQQD
jgi:hypothetical protein